MTKNKLSVSQLNNYIKGVFDDELILKNITVCGEVFEKSESGGNVFISLREDEEILRCVKFGGNFSASVGDKVALIGSVDYYAKGNRISFIFKDYFIEGEGKLRKEFLRLYETLSKEGLFINHPPLPKFIKKVGIITSETGAVIHDFISVLTPICPYVDVFVYPVKVQGEGSASEIISAINFANADKRKVDLLVLARGGGSSSDLENFNEEKLARTVANSTIPIISAIGHQIDYLLCDYCSSYRAGTPSIAGEKINKINTEFLSRYYQICERMSRRISSIYSDNANRSALVIAKLSERLAKIGYEQKAKLYSLYLRLCKNADKQAEKAKSGLQLRLNAITALLNTKFESENSNLKLLGARLDANSPLKLLSGGYAKVYGDGKLISSVSQLDKNDDIELYFADGKATAIVGLTTVRNGKK